MNYIQCMTQITLEQENQALIIKRKKIYILFKRINPDTISQAKEN